MEDPGETAQKIISCFFLSLHARSARGRHTLHNIKADGVQNILAARTGNLACHAKSGRSREEAGVLDSTWA